MLKIYTSRYQNPELSNGSYTVVGITRGAPKFPLRYVLAGNIIEIAPPGYLFNEYDRTRFTRPYFANMDRVGVAKIRSILNQYLVLGKDVVLCCYEDVTKPGEWCHRLVFAEWWKARTGETIEELKDPSTYKAKQGSGLILPKKEPEKHKEPEPEQLSLFGLQPPIA